MNSQSNIKIRRYITNPIEVFILSVTTLIFFNSVYNLFYQHSELQLLALTPMKAKPVSEGRSIASNQTYNELLTFELPCKEDSPKDSTIHANRIRIVGNICGSENISENILLNKTEVINKSNQFNATVFPDTFNHKFSTDYIPLSRGDNPIHIEFTYQNGRVTTQDLTLIKL